MRSDVLYEMYLDGYEIVVSGGPTYDRRPDGRWPVLFQPRTSADPYPWVAIGTTCRYESAEVESLPAAAQAAVNGR